MTNVGLVMTGVPRPPVYRIVILQLILTFAVALVAWLHSDVAAKSALVGGFICALPNAYFVWRAFRYRGARSSVQIVQSFYQGEAWKFVLTGFAFAAVFSQDWSLNYLALFAGFVTVQLGHLFSAKIANL